MLSVNLDGITLTSSSPNVHCQSCFSFWSSRFQNPLFISSQTQKEEAEQYNNSKRKTNPKWKTSLSRCVFFLIQERIRNRPSVVCNVPFYHEATLWS